MADVERDADGQAKRSHLGVVKPTISFAASKVGAGQGTGLNASVGANIRAERTKAGISLRDLARRVGVSPAFLSQFERGRSQAAVNTLFSIASELHLSIDELLGNHFDGSGSAAKTPSGNRSSRGRTEKDGGIELAEYLSFQAGVRWRRLGDLGSDKVLFLLTEYKPGSDSAPHNRSQTHRGNDYGYVLEGTLTVFVKNRRRRVVSGQAIAMRGDQPHRLRNETDQLVRVIWVVVDHP